MTNSNSLIVLNFLKEFIKFGNEYRSSNISCHLVDNYFTYYNIIAQDLLVLRLHNQYNQIDGFVEYIFVLQYDILSCFIFGKRYEFEISDVLNCNDIIEFTLSNQRLDFMDDELQSLINKFDYIKQKVKDRFNETSTRKNFKSFQ